MTNNPSIYELPTDLPVPEDDGACNHLTGMQIPSMLLPSTAEEPRDLSSLQGRTVVYCYPMTGRPGQDLPQGWNEIPGARGCTPQSCAFRDHYEELRLLETRVFGLSTQDTNYQKEAAERLYLTFELLSDESLRFATTLNLPTFGADSTTLIKRLTMIIRDGWIEKVFYPVFPPHENVEEVVRWLKRERARKETL